MINYKEGKQARMDSWLLELMSKDMKTKIRKQRSTNKKSEKNNRKIKFNN